MVTAVVKALRSKVQRKLATGRQGLETLIAPVPAMGVTPKTLLHERGTMRLFHYHPMADEVYRVPVLLVAATSNRSYIFDLAPGSSMVEHLLQQGHDVYVLDWNDPRPDEKDLSLEDYVLDFLPDCLHKIAVDSGEPDVNLVGYCMGGLLSVLYAALHPKGPVKHLVCLTTPVDFSEMELFQAWTDRAGFHVDDVVDSLGVMPASFVRAGFNVLRPLPAMAATARLWGNIRNPDFVQQHRMVTTWANDTLPLPGELFRQMVKDFFWDNKLHHGTLRLGRRAVNLKKITIPVLHIVAEHDHIVPYACAHPLIDAIGTGRAEEVRLKGGHVSVVAGPNARKRMWPLLDRWLALRAA